MNGTEKVTDLENSASKDASITESSKETFRTIIFALLIALFIRTFAFEPFNIPSSSMVPTLKIGDFLFVSKYTYGYGSRGTFLGLIPFSGRIGGSAPQRGDVVVFKKPSDPSIDYIKRLIGLPGDKIQMRHGTLYINGVPVERDRIETPEDVMPNEDGYPADFVEHLPQGPQHVIRKMGEEQRLDNTDVFSVPPRHYFFMGDNRDNSQDSRTTEVGFVPEENLVGKAQVLFFSIDEHTRFWELWKWPTKVRWSRLFMKVE